MGQKAIIRSNASDLVKHPNFVIPEFPEHANVDVMSIVTWTLQTAAAFISPSKELGENDEFSCDDLANSLTSTLLEALVVKGIANRFINNKMSMLPYYVLVQRAKHIDTNVVLCFLPPDKGLVDPNPHATPFVTWVRRNDTPEDVYWGHYHETFEAAFADFETR